MVGISNFQETFQMLITNPTSSTLSGEDTHKRQAAELLVHILQFQQVGSIAGTSGSSAAAWCADFIEQFAKRTAAMTQK
jgi:aspartate/tyrosine/aromatic aminotransferase